MTSLRSIPRKLFTWPAWLWRATLENPILYRELRSRMRSRRGRAMLSGSIIFIGMITAIAASTFLPESSMVDFIKLRQMGRTLFGVIISIQIALVTFQAPTLAAGSIAGEREQHTYDLLRTTTLTTPSIVWGKFISALAPLLLLLLVQLPFLVFTYTTGGIIPRELIAHSLVILVSAMVITALALLISSRSQRTASATFNAYFILLSATYFFPGVASLLISISTALSNAARTLQIAGFTMDTALLTAAAIYLLILLNPPAAMLASQALMEDGAFWFTRERITPNLSVTYPLPWLGFCILNLLLCCIFLWLTVRTVRRLDN